MYRFIVGKGKARRQVNKQDGQMLFEMAFGSQSIPFAELIGGKINWIIIVWRPRFPGSHSIKYMYIKRVITQSHGQKAYKFLVMCDGA